MRQKRILSQFVGFAIGQQPETARIIKNQKAFVGLDNDMIMLVKRPGQLVADLDLSAHAEMPDKGQTVVKADGYVFGNSFIVYDFGTIVGKQVTAINVKLQ